MSSTTGVQNLLVNVFRPVYFYDTTSPLYTVKLDLSNVNTYYGNTVSVLRADVGDGSNNVYVGKLSGNDPTVSIKACSNVTAIGYGAGSNISNVSNSTYLGFYAGAGAQSASAVIAIGSNANGNGTSNIFLGNGTGTTGSNNIFVGHGITLSNASYKLRVGAAGVTTLAGDLSRAWVGIGGTVTPINSNTTLDVSGDAYVLGNVGINISPGTRTLDVNGNFRAQDASLNAIDFSNGQFQSTGGFYSQRGSFYTTGGSSNIATLKKGMILISAQDNASSSTHFASSMVYCSDPTNGATGVWDMSGSYVQDGDVSLNYSSTFIRVGSAGSARTIDWSVTYFPLT